MPAPAIHPHPLPYVGLLAERALDAVDTVVIHCTELPDLATEPFDSTPLPGAIAAIS